MPIRKPRTRRKKAAALSAGLSAPETAAAGSNDLNELDVATSGGASDDEG